MSKLKNSSAAVSRYQIIHVTGDRHGQQKRIVRIRGFRAGWKPVKHQATLQIVDHLTDPMRLQNGVEFRVSADPLQLIQLQNRCDNLKPCGSPSLVNLVWWSVR